MGKEQDAEMDGITKDTALPPIEYTEMHRSQFDVPKMFGVAMSRVRKEVRTQFIPSVFYAITWRNRIQILRQDIRPLLDASLENPKIMYRYIEDLFRRQQALMVALPLECVVADYDTALEWSQDHDTPLGCPGSMEGIACLILEGMELVASLFFEYVRTGEGRIKTLRQVQDAPEGAHYIGPYSDVWHAVSELLFRGDV